MEAYETITTSQKMLGADKMWFHADRIAQWMAGWTPAPVTVELDVCNICNHRCPECTFSYLVNKSKDILPQDLAMRTIDELANIGVKAVTFSGGGEPLLVGEDRMLEMMRSVKHHGMDVGLITNGSKLTKEEFVDVCEWIRISLDAYDAETFDRFHGRRAKEFGNVLENVRNMCAFSLLRFLQDRKSATVGVGFLTDEGSLLRNDIYKMAEFCSKIKGLDYVQFRPMVVNRVRDPSLGGGWTRFSSDQLAEMAGECARASTKFGTDKFKVLMSVGKYYALSLPDFGKNYDMCWAHFLQCTISADGKVYICCHMQGDDRYCLGNLHKNSFEEVWRSDRAKEVFKSISPKKECPPACRLHQQNSELQQIAMKEVTHVNFI